MLTVENKYVKQAKYQFHGGIHPAQNKKISSETNSLTLPIPEELLFPFFDDESNRENSLSVGDDLRSNQAINSLNSDSITVNTTTTYHSPCDSQVLEISQQNLAHPSGLPSLSIRLKTQQKDATKNDVAHQLSPIKNWQNEENSSLLDRVKEAGIVGLGGAIFPTHLKLSSKANNKGKPEVKMLIINAMECEPYITCDDRLMREEPLNILLGALITAKIIGAETILIGIEDNKQDAIKALSNEIAKLDSQTKVEIVVAPTKYPSGGEKQLIQLLTGKEVPTGHYPASLGLSVQNIATIYSIHDAVIKGQALTKRLVSITGDAAIKPGNYWITFGTSISTIAKQLEIDLDNVGQIIFGGPLMGQLINDPSVPTNKSTNCIIFNNNSEVFNTTNTDRLKPNSQKQQPCIRCGQCELVCPASLVPQQLYWHSKSEQWKELQQQSLFDCIECGACNFVCPSNIPLVAYYRFAKSEIRSNSLKLEKSDASKIRFENREIRLLRIKTEREEKRKIKAEAREKAALNSSSDPDGKKSAIQDALARVKQKKNKQENLGTNG